MTRAENHDPVRSEAMDWVLRRDAGALSATEAQALDAWLARSPRHRELFDSTQAFWGATAQLDLLHRVQQLVLADLAQVLVEGRPVFRRPRKSFQSARRATLAPLPGFCYFGHVYESPSLCCLQASRRLSTTIIHARILPPHPRGRPTFEAWGRRTP